ncbi:MAG TPA: adenylate/guanylate cyclase domain-containing protein [bacterium]|jgi:pimeloyl-ACP methyl ester carboxylesterase|nr:adenylate/guanylate cyclase domain-containing protein [bacterium]
MPPQTRYAKSGALNIAYQVVGDGPIDLVCVPGWVSHVEEAWEIPALARFLNRLASFSRLILFDKRGTGMSDRVPIDALPTLEERMDDVRAVMDAAGAERAALFGFSEGGNMSILFAATYPQRTIALVTFGVFAKRLRSPDYPWAPTWEERQRDIALVEREWGGEMDLSTLAPSHAGDDAFMRSLATYLRRSASPGAAAALLRMNTFIDVREVLPAIRVPTLMLHRVADRDASIEEGRYMASRIPQVKFVELPGDDHLPWVGDADTVLDEIEEFLTGMRPVPEPDRVLATVLFVDMVGSTERAAMLGDRRWRDLLQAFHALVRRELTRFRGREIDSSGDGFLASFDGPARAIRAAVAITRATPELGLQVRAGLHTGEAEVMGEKLGGIAVHIGARVAALADPAEILVSSTVKDLVAGSQIAFRERGTHGLKGVPGTWQLFQIDPGSVLLARST